MSQRLAPGRRLGPLELREEIGRGGSAVVFRAWHEGRASDVAVKVISGAYTADDTFLARFRQEASFVSRLDHPHVLPLLESGETGPEDEVADAAYLVSEYMPGGSLSQKLEEERTTRERCVLAVAVAEQIGAALDHAHARDVLHRDLKPSNVLIAVDGRYVLSDFGLARVLQSGASLHLTATGLVAGTPVYMAPEQALGEAAEWRTDLYGLAVVLYEIVVGQVPFDAETPLATMLAHVHQPPPAPRSLAPDVPRAVEVVLLHALAKAPDDRYSTGYEMARALRAAVSAAFGEGALHRPLASTFPEAPALGARRPVRRKERVPALAARRPKRRWRPSLRILAFGAATCAAVVSVGAGSAMVAFGPGRPTLASYAERYASSSTGPSWTEALPRDGAKNEPLQTRIVVRFSHDMDHASVESSFSIVPTVPVTFEWDGRMLTVTPQEDLRESTSYSVEINGENTFDAQGRPLVSPLQRRFTTRALPVQAAQPAAGSLGGLPIFPLFQAQPTPAPTAVPERAIEIRPSATPFRPTATPRTANPPAAVRQSDTPPGPPAPTYAPPTAPAQPPDTSIVAGLVVTAEDAEAEAAALSPVTPVVPTPAASTTPNGGVSLVNVPPALPSPTPTLRSAASVTPPAVSTASGTVTAAGTGTAVATTSTQGTPTATPARTTAATPTPSTTTGGAASPSAGAATPGASAAAGAPTATSAPSSPGGQLATVTAMPFPSGAAYTGGTPPAASATVTGGGASGAATPVAGTPAASPAAASQSAQPGQTPQAPA